MIRGTTPTVKFTLPFDTSLIQSVYITFSQKGEELFTLVNSDCTFLENGITSKLSQRQTLALTHNAPVEIQIRVLTTDGNALASNIIRTVTEKILKDGEI